ncbi:unannotated protein [freshwater metagenome]|uniref:Unannotated protein n=1 Tax=freshwater metagenome TaxID=449393 RepID=A0A6J6NDE9_9ZZZZ
MISHNHFCKSEIIERVPSLWSAGAKGCKFANSGQVIDSISVAAFNFIVQEPKGIIVRSNARSLSARDRKYLIIEVSERLLVKILFVRYGVVRKKSSAKVSSTTICNSSRDSWLCAFNSRATETFIKSSIVVLSSSEIEIDSELRRKIFTPPSSALLTNACACAPVSVCTVNVSK